MTYVEPRTLEDDRVLVGVPDAARLLSVGRSTVYQLLASGALTSMKIGVRRLVPRRAIEVFVADCENAQRLLPGRALAEEAGGTARSSP